VPGVNNRLMEVPSVCRMPARRVPMGLGLRSTLRWMFGVGPASEWLKSKSKTLLLAHMHMYVLNDVSN